MSGLGSGGNGEFTFLDIISLMSFFIGLQNLDVNLTQDDKQELQQDLTDKTNALLTEIHSHLADQDKKLELLIKTVKEIQDGSK